MPEFEGIDSREDGPARIEILMATTWECNLRCTYCFVKHRGLTAPVEPMMPESASRVVDILDEEFSDAETICIHFYGGEPFCNVRAMRSVVHRALSKRKNKFNFAVTTNGTGATPEILDLLDKGQFGVIVSIDGPPEIHDRCRKNAAGDPTHRRVMQFLGDLRKKTSCWVRASSVVRSGWPLLSAASYLKNLDVDTIKCQAVRTASETDYSLDAHERQAYLDDLEALGHQVIRDIEQERSPRDDRFTSRIFQLLKKESRKHFCGAGTTMFGITPDGIVLPCILMDTRENSLGPVKARSFREAGRRWVESRRRKAECGSCSALPLCGGGCPALLPFCGDSECDIVRKNCDVASMIYRHFQDTPEKLLLLAGV